VPIWKPILEADGKPKLDDKGQPMREVIGVLAMTANLKDFTVLDKSMAGGNQVMLIDLRDDWVAPTKDRGLVLHHPRMEDGELFRLDEELLGKIDAAQPLEAQDFNGEDHFLTDYSDPVDGDNGKKYWGVFEPVRYAIDQGAEGDNDRFGWIVLVQKPMDE
jgi:hypothetical protein